MRLISKCIAAAFVAAMFSFSVRAAEPDVRWTTNFVEVRGLDRATLSLFADGSNDLAAQKQVLTVHADQPALLFDPLTPSIAGTCAVIDGVLRFKPYFPFDPGVNYRAVVRSVKAPGRFSDPIVSKHSVPAANLEPSTVVQNIYPTAASLPVNLLKFYVHFSAPMSGGRIYEYIVLLDDKGKPVELPFLEIDEELWDPSSKRLTLFLDPGRIKRGVKPLEDIGAAFETGRSYTLRIADSWKDARGVKLAKGFEKKFTVTPADRETPDPTKWIFEIPAAGVRDSIVVRFNEPLDHAIALRTISIFSDDGSVVEGSYTLESEERALRFSPDQAWKRGKYFVQAPTLIEDLAGNNIGEAFDVDMSQGRRKRDNKLIKLPFEVK